MRALTCAAMALSALALLAGCGGAPPPVLSASDQGDIGRITDYLNGLPRFAAHFTQTGDFGAGAGDIWLDRPGHLRVDYPGVRLMVITNGRVYLEDRATSALTTQKLSRTPLGMLLTPTISLVGAVRVADIHHDSGGITVTLQKTDAPGQGSLTLGFALSPLRLTQVTVVNGYRQSLTMFLDSINPAPNLAPALFEAPQASGS